MTTPTPLEHGRHCTRPAPQLRLSWNLSPEAWCPGCGRHTLIDIEKPIDTGTDRQPMEGRSR